VSIAAWFSRVRRRIRAWLRRHSYSFFSSLGVLLKHKIGTLMTVLVLGIAMFLPLGLYMTLSNLDGLNLRQEEWSAVTVFFRSGTTQDEVERVAGQLEQQMQAGSIAVISPAEGMLEFREASGFGESLDMLEENPLPWVMQVSPPPGSTTQVKADVEKLTEFLASVESVEVTQFDYKWHSEEIEILALVGAGNAFVRQPFLYSGLWYGLMGGLLAIILLGLSMLYLAGPIGLLLETYGTVFDLRGLGGYDTLWVLLGGGFLGWLGAWVSVQRYLRLLQVGGRLGRH